MYYCKFTENTVKCLTTILIYYIIYKGLLLRRGECVDKREISYSSLDDDKLALLSSNGDDKAFNELVVRYLGLINNIAFRYYAEGYELKDFVQEGLLGMLYSCRTYDNGGLSSFKSYLSLIVERRFISIVRRFNSQKAVPQSAVVHIDSVSDELESQQGNPEELLLCREQLEGALRELRSVLSRSEYEVLMLFCAGLSYRQIAKKLNISEKSADNALQRARKKISSMDMS